ncbi:hypothetical protein B0T25DRAFT_446864 [Lasiosphaeria hispida]|uniref:Uncharacterized protein n=1 Tax=Lasiosphaeria hispida TaxID=260671 RepID=A0AAJ0HS15_9PEZI|nr:hypothetical protein B0T25DRAFT_446864 [Lasiosphaeria hispida]
MADSESAADSPLSIAGNITGILTFALGVFSFCAAFYAITYDAHREIQDLKDAVAERKSHVDELERYFEELDVAADADFEQSHIKPIVEKSLSGLKARHVEVEKELAAIRGRLQWWYRRQDITSSLARIETQLQHLGAIQLTFLLL